MALHSLWSPKTSGEKELRPAIGVSLTVSYGTVSMRHPDGRFEDMGMISGSNSYVEMMKRLSKAEAEHLCRPYSSLDDMWADIPRKAWRSARTKLGLAASPDVKTLSRMIQDLLALAPTLHLPVVLISFPALAALYHEDISDAAEYLGLPKLRHRYYYHPRELIAAYAGHGMGLYKSYKRKAGDSDTDEDAPDELPRRQTLVVEYTEHALLLHNLFLSEAVDLADTYIDAVSSFELGRASCADDGYVQRVADFVEWFMGGYPPWGSGEILVIMTGDPVDDAVRDAIVDGVKSRVHTVDSITAGSEYVAARGAAELAWRSNVLGKHV